MTKREAILVGGFAIFIGAFVLAISVAGAVFAEVPPPSTSSTRNALIRAFVALFGREWGYRAIHLTYSLGAALLLWVGIKILRHRP